MVLGGLVASIAAALRASLRATNAVSDDQARSVATHRAVLDALRRRDGAGARAAMNAVLDNTEHDLEAVLSRAGPPAEIRRAVHRAGLLGIVLLAGPARAAPPDWADAPESKRPEYAGLAGDLRPAEGGGAARRRRADGGRGGRPRGLLLRGAVFRHRPSGRSRAARLCAFVEKRDADPQVTNFGYTGDNTLMMVYANGLGAPRNLDVATALACRADGAPAENDGRVKHLAALRRRAGRAPTSASATTSPAG